MRIIRHPEKGKLHRPVVALGTFDGVHLGHRRVIEAAVKYAKKIKAHGAVITFDPHPQEVIAPARGLRLLTDLEEREAALCQLGVEAVVVMKFTNKMKTMSAGEFVKKYLFGKLGVRQVFVGYDYAFGQGRKSGTNELKKLGQRYGFGLTVIPPVIVNWQIAKSGRIREYLCSGKFAQALKLLGRPYSLSGRVIKGVGRGKTLGFPTANLKIDGRKLIPMEGVYFGYVGKKRAVVNIGSRPTFGSGQLLVEVHILGYHGNLRGQNLRVDLVKRFRDERQFNDVNELVAQIKNDIVRARQM